LWLLLVVAVVITWAVALARVVLERVLGYQ
jgi:hypothetical protein